MLFAHLLDAVYADGRFYKHQRIQTIPKVSEHLGVCWGTIDRTATDKYNCVSLPNLRSAP